MGLGFGADDYIEKPFSPAVLVARVKAHLAQYARLTGTEQQPAQISLGGITVQPEEHRVYRQGQELVLKPKEYELLLFLMQNPERVFSREELYEKIWGMEAMGDNATVAVHINRLREKIEENPAVTRAVFSLATGCRVRDTQTGLRAFSTRLLSAGRAGYLRDDKSTAEGLLDRGRAAASGRPAPVDPGCAQADSAA